MMPSHCPSNASMVRSMPFRAPWPSAVHGVSLTVPAPPVSVHVPSQSMAPLRFCLTMPSQANVPLAGHSPGNSACKSASGHSTVPCPVASKLPVSKRMRSTLPDQSTPSMRNATWGASARQAPCSYLIHSRASPWIPSSVSSKGTSQRAGGKVQLDLKARPSHAKDPLALAFELRASNSAGSATTWRNASNVADSTVPSTVHDSLRVARSSATNPAHSNEETRTLRVSSVVFQSSSAAQVKGLAVAKSVALMEAQRPPPLAITPVSVQFSWRVASSMATSSAFTAT